MSNRQDQSEDRTEGTGSFVTARPVAILMLFIAAVVFGYFSYARLPVTLMPELTYPTLTVRTEYPGAAPEEVENDISRPVEEALGVIGGLQQISSISRAGASDVVLEFSWDTDVSDATQSVLERLDMVFLPSEAKRPLILHFDPSLDPVMELSMVGAGDEFEGEEGLRRLRRLADRQVKRVLEPIRGVAAVRIKGGLEEEIHVLLDEGELRRTGTSIQRVISRLGQENINVAGGTIQEGRTEYLVRTINEYESLRDIEETIVASFEGRDVRIGDLGEVRSAHKERQIITRTDGRESVQIEIFKEADANIVSLAHRIKSLVGPVPNQKDDDLIADAEPAEPKDDGGEPGDENKGDDDQSDQGVNGKGDEKDSGRGKGRGGEVDAAAGLAETLYDSEGAVLQVLADRSLFIESSIKEVRNTAIIGGLLAVVVLFLFLRNFVSTSIIAVSIPVSLLITFAPLHLLGVSLNVMSLGGLALGIGMLVDSSIVVLESIQRCRDEGDGIIAATLRGTNEVRTAVFASILTSIAVFFPMVFVEGVAGQAFGDLGLAVVVSLLASLVVALFLIPMLASRTGGVPSASEAGGPDVSNTRRLGGWGAWSGFRSAWRGLGRVQKFVILPVLYIAIRFLIGSILEAVGKLILAVFLLATWLFSRYLGPVIRRVFKIITAGPTWLTDKLLGSIQATYPRALRWTLRHPGVVGVLVLGVLFVTLQTARSLSSELLPEVRQGEFTFEVALPVGMPLAETEAVLTPVERVILSEGDEIAAVILTVGFDPTQSQRSDEGEHTARFKILLEKGTDNAGREDRTIRRLREKLDRIPDLDATVTRPVLFSSKTPIEVEIYGDDLRELKKFSDQAREVLANLTSLADVQSSLKRGAPEVQMIYDRERLSRYGLNIGDVARLVRDKVKGFEATRFNMTNRRVPILVQLGEEDRRSVEDVSDIVVNPGGERPISLAAVAEVSLGEGPSEVRRVDGRRVALIEANIAEGSLSSASADIREALQTQIDWPDDVTFLLGGQNQEWDRSRSSLWMALALSVFLVYVIMAAQFESLVHPLVIMFTIPLAFVGTMIVLKLLSIPLSVVVFLGMIMLAGIVVNNAIVLVDYINTLRRRGLDTREAIVEAGAVRLRPILMTTATTVLGLLPMALGLGDGSEIRTPMAIAVISGLITSTVLTLFVIPVIYSSAESTIDLLRGRRGRGESSPTVGLAEGPAEVTP